MTKVLRTSFFLTVCFFLYNAVVLSQEETVQYSILTTSNTDGSHELLAKKAEAFQQFKTQQSIAMSFGSILGPTRIVENDNGLEFLRAAHRAGIDYIIPAKGEFMFGAASFKILVEFSGVPEFISANILDEKSRKTLLKPYFVWDVSGLRLCVIGFSDMNIIKDSPDEAVEGIDIISFDEALDSISDDVKRLRADIVIAAGAIGRDAIMAMARKYPFIDTFITNNRSGGFADTKGVTSTVFIADKPVYITSEEGDHIGHVIAKYVEGMESRELTDTVLGDMFPPEKVISAYINRIIDELKRKDFEETVTVKGGKEVAGILREIYGVDVVFLERQSLYYYPLEDSLTLLDMRRLIKPSPKVTAFSLKGERLKLILEKSKGKPVRALRLHYSGITEDAKVDSIPIQDDREYTVLTTEFLRNGG
ncbi:MAG: hypothetical protein HOC71_11325, partial [Candidatus Latescibacteria bacterium]|nr:hypothetical protein [Candidatus Latescibacterota bacterium]